jgi:hypothetical protein
MAKLTDKNRLCIKYPDLAKEWHPTKNGNLIPEDISFGSKKTIWWKCSICKKEWQTSIQNRLKSKEKRCVCYKSLAITHPELAKEWHPTKNGNLTPFNIRGWSRKEVWWYCIKCGHEWKTSIMKRCQGYNSCFKCRSLGVLNPELAKEWHPTKNGKLTIYNVNLGSSQAVWWQHVIKGEVHEWRADINSRNNGNNCPYCSGAKICMSNCLAITHPELTKEWHLTKNGNLTPYDVGRGSKKKVWWVCLNKSCKHEWETEVYHRNDGNGCPECNKNSPTTVILNDGIKCASKAEAYWYLTFQKYHLIFEHDKAYGNLGSKGKMSRYDFYFPEGNLYVEVTSYLQNLKDKKLKRYWERIKKKEKYVKEVLKAKFLCICFQPTKEEYAYVEEKIAKII